MNDCQSLNVKRLLLYPSGGLQLLPLHAAWRPGDDGRPRALLDDYEVIYAPSAYAISTANHRTEGRTGKTALVVGVNAYQKLPPLQNAVPEATTIAGLFQALPLLDSAASKSAVKAAAPGAAYVHLLLSRGSFNWRGPTDSALYLANDEPLTLSEIISDLNLQSARLVILSACETGIWT